jgi:hypothetical protein
MRQICPRSLRPRSSDAGQTVIESLPARDGSPEQIEASGTLLDRTGKRLGVPVATGVRTDGANGQKWLTADLVLAPLGAGDYIIELTLTRGGAQQRVLSAFRVSH